MEKDAGTRFNISAFETKADALMIEAENGLKKFSLFSSGSAKASKAHELYLQAATSYSACGKFGKAADAYHRAADLCEKAERKAEEVVLLERGAKAYLQDNNTSLAKAMYVRALARYDSEAKTRPAAKVCAAIGDFTTGKEAIEWMQRAMQYYRMAGSNASAAEVARNVADMHARCGHYQKAQVLYEQLGKEAMDGGATRCGARKLFFFALLTRIATMTSEGVLEEAGELQELFETYQEWDTQFNEHCREHMLITAIIDAINCESVESYEKAVEEYNRICPLDASARGMLLKGMEALQARVEGLR